jgi:hypothetical protein
MQHSKPSMAAGIFYLFQYGKLFQAAKMNNRAEIIHQHAQIIHLFPHEKKALFISERGGAAKVCIKFPLELVETRICVKKGRKKV